MQFSYNPEISLGNILQIVTIVMGIGAGYSALVKANALQDQILLTHEEKLIAVQGVTKEAAKELKEDVKEIQRDVKMLDQKFTTYVIESARTAKR